MTLKLLSKHIQTAAHGKKYIKASKYACHIEHDDSDSVSDAVDTNQNIKDEEDVCFGQVKERILNFEPQFDFGSSLDSVTAHAVLTFFDAS